VLVPGTGNVSPELMREVAGVASTMVEVVRLRLELSRALHEVESSRARLVQSGDEERRRLERDLHDGAQQRLVSLGMAIRLAQRHIDDGTVDFNGLLEETVAELGTAVAELRQIAHGLRPSSLDDGLPTALARLVRSVPVAVEMDIHPGPLPDDVATTAYFLISEAVTNAVKHAEASRISLHVSRVNGTVRLRITDDGRGGATLSPESGLADRVAALGGSLDVTSPTGRGTVVEAALPCAS
jgi:signal transduction histidine kinase